MARSLAVLKGPALRPPELSAGESTSPPLPPLPAGRSTDPRRMLGCSAAMAPIFATIRQVAAVEVDVLIIGPTGTGKELVAQAIHEGSLRRDGPFVPVNCGAIPDGLMESDFFGHERGAFTGAQARSAGLLEEARSGTVLLDEVNQLPWPLQAKLLRVVQERTIRRVGSTREIALDVRLLAASSVDLAEQVERGQFRADLYHRLNVVRIDLPPLRERREDIALLADHFCSRCAKAMAQRPLTISPEAMERLQDYAWPGNVRELENMIKGLAALMRGAVVGIEDLPHEIVTTTEGQQAPGRGDFLSQRQACVRAFELQYLDRLLRVHRGNAAATARAAGLPRWTLYRLLKRHGLNPGDFRIGPQRENLPENFPQSQAAHASRCPCPTVADMPGPGTSS